MSGKIASPARPVTLVAQEIAKLLDRQRRMDSVPGVVPMHELFEEILRIANKFVPSESGSVLIDDPILKRGGDWTRPENELIFVACFGAKASELLGRRIPADRGIVGKTYRTGQPWISSDVSRDEHFDRGIDALTDYETRTVISVPIHIERATCGVLELINRHGRINYVESELRLLQIFAGYISTSLQNVLDANRYRELAKRDDLTGLFNDRYFTQQLSEEVEQAEREQRDLSLIFLDLDHFKGVNDRHGHLVGSQTLREVGVILATTVSNERGVAARYGGDEFVVIYRDADLEEGVALAEKIRERIARSLFRIDPNLDGSGVMLVQGTITASLGVASYRDLNFAPDEGLRTRKNEFIRAADQAMYVAKEQGKNRVCRGDRRVSKAWEPRETPAPRGR